MDLVYPGLLHTRLKECGEGEKFEIINAGIEGYHSGFALVRLKEDVLQYHKDMVAFYVGWNDLMRVNPKNLSEIGLYTWLAQLMEQSFLLKAYKKLIFFCVRPLVANPAVVAASNYPHANDLFEVGEYLRILSK